jgi:hypothetical protein
MYRVPSRRQADTVVNNSTAGTSAVISTVGAVTGDVCIVGICVQGNTSVTVTPAGWVSIRNALNGSGASSLDCRINTYGFLVVDGAATSHTFTLGASVRSVTITSVFRDVDPALFFDANPASTNPSANSATVPVPVTTGTKVAGLHLVYAGVNGAGVAGLSITPVAPLVVDSSASNVNAGMALATEPDNGTHTYAASNVTLGSAAVKGTAVSILLRAAPRLEAKGRLLRPRVPSPTQPAKYTSASALLSWAPPGGYQGYTVVHMSDANLNPSLSAETDYLVVIDSKITQPSAILNGGRNVVVIGGEIDLSSQPANRPPTQLVGIKFYNQTGVVFIEGLWIHGSAPAPLAATAVAATDVVTATGHTFQNGEQVCFVNMTGGAGIAASTPYFVINRTANTLQLSLTSGGSALDITSDLTAGVVHRASGALGDGINFNNITKVQTGIGGDKAVTGVSATSLFTTTVEHGFEIGDRVNFTSTLTGGTGLIGSAGWVYYVADTPSPTTFKLASARSNSTRTSFSTDLTAGTIARANMPVRRTDIYVQNCRIDWARADCKAAQDTTAPYDVIEGAMHPDIIQWFGGGLGASMHIDKLTGSSTLQGLFTQAPEPQLMDYRRVNLTGVNYDGSTIASAGLFYNSVDTATDWRHYMQDCYASSPRSRAQTLLPDVTQVGFGDVVMGTPAGGDYVSAGGAGQAGMSYVSPGYR